MNVDLKRVGIVFGCLFAGTGFMFSVTTGCGNNSAGNPVEDAGMDAGTDATADASHDVAADTTSPDADASPINDSGSGFVDVGDVAIDVPPSVSSRTQSTWRTARGSSNAVSCRRASGTRTAKAGLAA